jgi:flagellar capping protein FliD
MATNAKAFEQIYAVNAGGDAHTDTDGIVYQKHDSPVRKEIFEELQIGTVPESDRSVYKTADETLKEFGKTLKFNIPLRNDGVYVLIAKFSNHNYEHARQSVTYNGGNHLHENMSVHELCGGNKKICDEYYYFCVSDKTLYFKDQSSAILNGEIRVEIRPVQYRAYIAGLVLLKGTIGEHQKLQSSATNESLDFHAMKMNPRCLIPSLFNEFEMIKTELRETTKKLQKSEDNICDNSSGNVTSPNTQILDEVASLQKQQKDNFNRIEDGEQDIKNSLKTLSEALNQVAKTQMELKSAIEGIQSY